MPISSYHRLTSNSTCKPWNTTRSPHRPRSQSVRSTRKWHSERPRCRSFHVREKVAFCTSLTTGGVTTNGGNKALKIRSKSATDTTDECVRNKQSAGKCVRSRSASTLGRRTVKRRETHPFLRSERDENSSAWVVSSTETKSDFLIRSKVSRWKQANSRPPKKLAWNAKGKERSELATMKLKEGLQNKVHSSPTVLPSSPTNGFPSGGSLYKPDIGERLTCVLDKRTRFGELKYRGRTHFAEGEWCGVVLDKPCGKNDGSVRGVRYFQCKSKHGIFVHSHKVWSLDDYWEWFCTQANWENNRLTPSKVLTENLNWNNRDMSCVEKPCTNLSNNSHEHRARSSSRKIDKRTRSRSLDRYLLVKVKLPRQSGFKRGTQLVRSVSLPKIEGNCFLVSGKSSSDNKDRLPLHGVKDFINNIHTEISNGKHLAGSEELDLLQSSGDLDCTTEKHEHTTAGHKKLGHTMSLDAHFRMKHGFGNTDSSANGWHADYSEESNLGHSKTVDAFLEGQYSSCPSLVPSSAGNRSDAIATCLDLGQVNREMDEVEKWSDQKDADNDRSKARGERLPEKSDLKLKLKGSSASHSKLIHSSSPLAGFPQSETDRHRLSCPSLLPQSTQNDATPMKSDTISKKCLMLDPLESDVDLVSVEGNETASSCSPRSGSEASVSSTGVCSTEESQAAAESCVSKASSMKLPSMLKRPDGIKRPVSARPMTKLGKIPHTGKKNVTPTGGNGSGRLEMRPSNMQLDKRLQKRHTLATLSGVKSIATGSSTQRGTPDYAAVKVYTNSPEVKEVGKPSKLPLLKKSSSPQIQPASNVPVDISLAGKTEGVPVLQLSSGLKGLSVKPVKPKATVSSRNTPQGVAKKKADPAPSSKPYARNIQTFKGSTAVTQESIKSATRRTSTSSSKVARTPGLTTGVVRRVSTSSVPEEKKVGPTPKPGIKHPSKPITSVTQSTSKQSTRLPKLPSRRTPRTLSTPESSTSDNIVAENYVKKDEPDGPTSTNCAPRRNSHQQGVTVQRKDIYSPVCVSDRHVTYHAPDILSQTPEVTKHSVGVQVEDEKRKKTIEDLKSKAQHLEELLRHNEDHRNILKESLTEISVDCVAAAILVNGFGGQLQLCGRQRWLLQKKAHILLEDLKHSQKQLADEESNGIKLQEEIMYITSEHKVGLETLKADHDRVLEELRQNLDTKYDEEMKLVAKWHLSRSEEEKALHTKDIESLTESHKKSTAVLVEQHMDEITELENKQSQDVEEIMEEHQVEIETIKADYEEQQTKLKDKIDGLGSECRSLSQKLKNTQEEAQRDMEARIQDAIKSYQSLPAELESTKAVLEIRNEDIKGLRQEKMEIKMELERLQIIQERIQKLEHENESLSFVVETKSAFHRQLSVERDSLKNSLEREAKKANRLSLEKEELQWRLCNSPCHPLSADSSDVSPQQYRLSCSFPDVSSVEE